MNGTKDIMSLNAIYYLEESNLTGAEQAHFLKPCISIAAILLSNLLYRMAEVSCVDV
jgi:hypothetical protein